MSNSTGSVIYRWKNLADNSGFDAGSNGAVDRRFARRSDGFL
jgi:hypothetical protein